MGKTNHSYTVCVSTAPYVIYGVRLDRLSRANRRRHSHSLTVQSVSSFYPNLNTSPTRLTFEPNLLKNKMKITRDNVVALLR